MTKDIPVNAPQERMPCLAPHREIVADPKLWEQCRYVGIQKEDEPTEEFPDLELRDCTCGSTLARPVEKKNPPPAPPLITDTSRLSSTAKLATAALPGGVKEQEAQGQQELVASAQLPIQGLLGKERPRWEALGLKILDDQTSDDSLFCQVELPPGWRKVPTDHPLWTNLVDADGKVIADICYKAAFYDRHAHVSLKADPAPSTEPGCVCADCGHEQSTMDPCESCRSVRTVLVTVVRDQFGENWRDAFAPEENAQ